MAVKKARSFRNNPIVLFTLLSALFRCSWKFNLVSRYFPRCFRKGNLLNRVVIEANLIMIFLLKFSWKYKLLSLFTRIGFKIHFPLNCPVFDLFKSRLKLVVDVFILRTIEISEVSSAKSLTFVVKSSERSLI